MITYIVKGWPKYIQDVEKDCKIFFKYKDELSTQEGLVFRNRILIPTQLGKTMLNRVHVTHTGIEATMNLARDTIFWSGMSKQIQQKN